MQLRLCREMRVALQLSRLALRRRPAAASRSLTRTWRTRRRGSRTRSASRPIRSQAHGGLLWAYLGPQPAPLVPDWEFFSLAERVPPDRDRRDPVQLVPVPGELDRPGAFRMDALAIGASALAGTTGPYTPHARASVDFSEFEYGFQYKRIRTDTDETDRLWTVGRVCLWPNALFTGNHIEFRVPIDDENTLSRDVAFQPRADGSASPTCRDAHPDLAGADRRRRDRALDHQPRDEPGFRRPGSGRARSPTARRNISPPATAASS